MTLSRKFIAALAEAREYALNPVLALLKDEWVRIESAAPKSAFIADGLKQLDRQFDETNPVLNGHHTNQFLQKFGELQAACLLIEKGLSVTKIPQRTDIVYVQY